MNKQTTPAAELINTAAATIRERHARTSATIRRQNERHAAAALNIADAIEDYPGAARLLTAAAAHIERRKGTISHV